MASAMASTVSGTAMGRSGADSLPPPLIRQGLTLIFSSSTATLRIALSSRYAFSGCVLLNDRGDTESADRWSWLIAAAYPDCPVCRPGESYPKISLPVPPVDYDVAPP